VRRHRSFRCRRRKGMLKNILRKMLKHFKKIFFDGKF
jgi:hypothetical protein